MLIIVATLILLGTICAADEDSTLTGAYGPFHLVDSSGDQVHATGTEGLLLYNGGTVCDDGFSDNSANAICIEMGFNRSKSWRAVGNDNNPFYRYSLNYEIVLDEVRCSDSSWVSCSYRTSHNCDRLENVLLTCSDYPACDGLSITGINARRVSPFALKYEHGDKATIFCATNYFISWGTSIDDVEGNIECNAGSFVPDPAVGGVSTVGCVACADNVADCVGGTCTEYGECLCNDGYEKSNTDPRLCTSTSVQCDAFVLSNQAASADGPYNVDDVVTVTCTAGYHVSGGPDYDVNIQTLICGSSGYFDIILRPCVVCADDNDCTDGTCNSYNICECDASAGYKLKEDDLNVCEEVTCPEKYCSYGGECVVKDVKLECDCPQGTEGDTCEQFTSTPCDPDPCEKGETCSRVMTDPADYTKHECTTAACEGTFNGDCCQVVIQFHDGAICMF